MAHEEATSYTQMLLRRAGLKYRMGAPVFLHPAEATKRLRAQTAMEKLRPIRTGKRMSVSAGDIPEQGGLVEESQSEEKTVDVATEAETAGSDWWKKRESILEVQKRSRSFAVLRISNAQGMNGAGSSKSKKRKEMYNLTEISSFDQQSPLKRRIKLDEEAFQIKEQVEKLLAYKFEIDICRFHIPIRLEPAHVLEDIAIRVKNSLNAHSLDTPAKATHVRDLMRLPQLQGRQLHSIKYHSERGISRSTLPSSTQRHRSVISRSVSEIIALRGLTEYQLAAEIAKEVGKIYLFLNEFDGLSSNVEGAFGEFCAHLWLTTELEKLKHTNSRIETEIREKQVLLEEAVRQLQDIQTRIDMAQKERQEADEAELVAEKKVAEAKRALQYGWPGANRKLNEAKAAQENAAKELEEAVEAERIVAGEQKPAIERQKQEVEQEISSCKQKFSNNVTMIDAISLFLNAQESNSHVIYGQTFRHLIHAVASMDWDVKKFLQHLKESKHLPVIDDKLNGFELDEQGGGEAGKPEEKFSIEKTMSFSVVYQRMKQRLQSKPLGAFGATPSLFVSEGSLHVSAEPAKNFEDQVLEELDDRISLSQHGDFSSKELSELCGLVLRNKHDQQYCCELGRKTLKEAQGCRAEGKLREAEALVGKARDAFGQAGDLGQNDRVSLESFAKKVQRDVHQLDMAVSCHKQAEEAARNGALTTFRRFWNNALELYQSCGAAANKPGMLPALEELDRRIKVLEEDVSALEVVLSQAKSSFEEENYFECAKHVSVSAIAS
eukprot:763418-Hanusia_phi.AAC.8